MKNTARDKSSNPAAYFFTSIHLGLYSQRENKELHLVMKFYERSSNYAIFGECPLKNKTRS